jgi:mRNA-degrading endonuclease RelE of RelBE toxin-antitoxin system
LHLQENDPTEETRNKFRLRRPSAHADYELRLGEFRVFYRVRDEIVEVVLIGRKQGNRILIGGEEFDI